MVEASSQIEIQGSPEHVREVMLDFAQIPNWSKSLFKYIKPAAQKPTVEKGDKLEVALQGGMTFTPTVLENSPEKLVWRGSLWNLFIGDHYFCFQPSKITPGSTTFVHKEEFSGYLVWIFKWASFTDTAAPFASFNEDLKRKVEASQ